MLLQQRGYESAVMARCGWTQRMQLRSTYSQSLHRTAAALFVTLHTSSCITAFVRHFFQSVVQRRTSGYLFDSTVDATVFHTAPGALTTCQHVCGEQACVHRCTLVFTEQVTTFLRPRPISNALLPCAQRHLLTTDTSTRGLHKVVPIHLGRLPYERWQTKWRFMTGDFVCIH